MANPRLGVDLAGLDLRSTLQGDLALIDDRGNVRAAIYRRLDTPQGRLIFHPWYGNSLHELLSEPLDASFSGRAIAAIRQCLSQEPRIELKDIEVAMNPEERRVIFNLTYTILDYPGTDNIVWEVDLP